MNSAAQKIENSIENLGRGRIFFADDFVSMGSAENIRQTLLRCAKSDKIVRVAKGIYCYPQIDDKLGLGIIMPSYDQIANAIAERAHARIIPTGDYALNVLGLSTQVPMNCVYLTDGTPRKVEISGSQKADHPAPWAGPLGHAGTLHHHRRSGRFHQGCSAE